MSDLEYPEDLRYTSEHEWVRTGQEGVVRIGITSYAQDALGDVVYVSLPAVGDELAVGDTCGEIESTKSVADLIAPASGEVTAVNGSADDDPAIISTDPHGEGWLYEIAPAGPTDDLLDADGYAALIAEATA